MKNRQAKKIAKKFYEQCKPRLFDGVKVAIGIKGLRNMALEAAKHRTDNGTTFNTIIIDDPVKETSTKPRRAFVKSLNDWRRKINERRSKAS